MQNMLTYCHDKDIDMIKLVLYQTWPTLVYTNLRMRKSIRSQREIMTFWKNLGKMLLMVHLSFFHEKQLLMKLLFEKQQSYATLLVELILANYTPTRCVDPYRPVCTHVGISIQRRVDSGLDNTIHVSLIKWSCPIFNEQDQNVKLKTSILQPDRKLTWRIFVHTATLFSKQWAALNTFVPVKKSVPLSLKKISIAVARKESSMNWHEVTYRKKALLSLKSESVSGGDCKR